MPGAQHGLCQQEGRESEDVPMRIDPQDLLKFVRTVYINASLFFFIWAVIVLIISSLRFRLHDHLPVPPYAWLAVALGILIVIACVRTRRFPDSVLWTLILAIVLLVTLFTISFTYAFSMVPMISGGIIAGVVMFVLIMMGARCRKSCLPNALVYTVVVAICLIGIFATGFLGMVTQKLQYVIGLCVFFVLLAMAAALIQSQFIHGRMHYVPWGQELLCSLGLFVTSVVLLLCWAIFIGIAEHKLTELPTIIGSTSAIASV